jgi:hypothetical protein
MEQEHISEKFPVFYTQGGGYVREVKTSNGYQYFFIGDPPAGFEIGDMMPSEWGIIAANYNAMDSISDEESRNEHGI